MDEKETYDWVTRRAKCSLDAVFVILAEVLDSDVKLANELKRPGVTFSFSRQALGKVMVTRTRDLTGIAEAHHVVFERTSAAITATARDMRGDGKQLFVATPNFMQAGHCLLRVGGEDLQLWQVSRKALEDLFFDF